MTDEEILTTLRNIAKAELELRPEQVERIQMATPIVDGLQLDSLKQVILLTSVEERFQFELTLEDRQSLQGLANVGDLVRFVRRRTAG